MSKFPKSAKLLEELVDYDGPQLLLLQSSRGLKMLAVAVRRVGMELPFFGCEIASPSYQRYFSGASDLHYTFKSAINQRYYFFDLDQINDDGVVRLGLANGDQAEDLSFWPKVGFFARSHTNPFNEPPKTGVKRVFSIDGTWKAVDFSRFHSKMADLYALFGSLSRLVGAQEALEKGFIANLIQDRLWQGGGSYVSFFDGLDSRNSLSRVPSLEVAAIRYASPGEVILRGDPQLLGEIDVILDILRDESSELRHKYKSVYSILRKEKLLSADHSKEFSSDLNKNIVKDITLSLAQDMGIGPVDELYAACNSNVALFAKVILSIFRRAYAIHQFEMEGRVRRSDDVG